MCHRTRALFHTGPGEPTQVAPVARLALFQLRCLPSLTTQVFYTSNSCEEVAAASCGGSFLSSQPSKGFHRGFPEVPGQPGRLKHKHKTKNRIPLELDRCE